MSILKKQTSFLCLAILLAIVTQAQDSSLEKTINRQSLQEMVALLAADSMMGRMTGSNEILKAGNWITQQFMYAGLYPVAGNNGYWQPFYTNSIPILTGYNIVAALPGKSKTNEVIIFCAHYDHIGTNFSSSYNAGKKKLWKESKDTIFNGANDNASGVAALISLANYFAALKNNERTLLFVAFSGEELNLVGSSFFSKNIDADKIIAVINLEMLGRYNNTTRNAYITGSKKTNLLPLLNEQLKKKNYQQYKKGYFKYDAFDEHRLFERSDNYSFALKGIPAHTIITSHPEDVNYHTVHDAYTSLDYKRMEETIKAIALAVRGLIDGSDTPTRIKN